MALVDIQRFITQYVRDVNFREKVKQSGNRTEGLKLTKKEAALIEELNLNDLDKTAEGFLTERLERRRKEFREFFEHLEMYYSIKDFFSLYDRHHPDGLLIRAIEMDRFLNFATEFIVQRGLPYYLIDILRFDYYYSKLCDTPIKKVDESLENVKPKDFKLYFTVQLKEPYKVLDLRWDILSIAQAQPNPAMANAPLTPTRIIIQKDWSAPKVTRIKYTSEIPLLSDLLEGPIKISEMLARYDVGNYSNLMQVLASMYQQGMIHITQPGHFNQ